MTIVDQSGDSIQEHSENKEYNDKDGAFHGTENYNHLCKLLKKTICMFQTYKYLRESLHKFDTQNNKSMNNVIAYILPKKMMAHIMIHKNRIYCVVGISILWFKKYWHTVFNIMELSMSPTFKHFLQAEIVNADKKA